MPQTILMPALSPGMTEGRVARWLKARGDAVRAGEAIAEIETDKATLELEAAEGGTLGEILVAAGGVAAVNGAIAILLRAGEQAAAVAPPTSAAAPAAPGHADGRIFASPIARRLARERDVDLSLLVGSGPRGRILRGDVERAAPRSRTPAPAAAPHAPSAAAPEPARGPSDAPRAPVRAAWQVTTAVPNGAVRKVIARRLLDSKRAIPHYYLTIDVELDALLDARKRLNARCGAAGKVTVNDFVVKALALALRAVPAANATWTDDAILRFESVDVAVAVESDAGLVTPIVRGADRKALAAISGELKELAGRARAGKLRPEEYQGGGVTVSNLGMHGVREFAAIINPPQSCILAVGAAEPRAVVREGAVVARTMMTCTLSADHRTIDGALGAELLAAFKAHLEDPLLLLL